VRADEPDRTRRRLALAATRRAGDDLGRGDPAPRLHHRSLYGVGSDRLLAEPGLLLVADADRRRGDRLGSAFGADEPGSYRRAGSPARPLPGSRRVGPAA